MVTQVSAPVGTVVRILDGGTGHRSVGSREHVGRVGKVTHWSNNCAKVGFEDDWDKWFLAAEVELYDPNHCGDALSRIRG